MRIAYVVSRFPAPTETFILRELNAVASHTGVEIELFRLFPPQNAFVHPAAQHWVERVHTVTPVGAVRAFIWWLARRPGRVVKALASVIAGHWRDPRRLGRALVACGPAFGHARTMRRLRIEHVHAHFATYPAQAAWLAGRLLDVPYSFTAHAHDIYIDQLQLGTRVREARGIVAISEFNARVLEPYRLESSAPISIVRCGIVPEAYAFRARVVPAQGTVRALCVASLNEIKGHSVLFDALASEAPELERVELDLVGGGPLEGQLRAQVARLGLERRVRFHGTLSETEVAQMLDAADVFVLASVRTPNGWMDGIPVALMEAMAAGVPVIATRLSGIPELVRDGETGLLAEPGDVGDLVAAFQRLLSHPDAAVERSQAGRRLIEREFDIERSADSMLEIFSPVEQA